MIGRRFIRRAILASLVSVAALAPSAARQWNPDARSLSLDYSQIFHTRAAGDVVVVWWVVPETFVASPGAQGLRDVLSRYVVIGAAHGHATPGAPPTFEDLRTLSITDSGGRTLMPLPGNALPPGVSETVANLQMLGRQSLGPMGVGLRWFVFDGSTIHSCEKGRMTVPLEGTVYTYDTPIPGCAVQR